MPSDDDPAGISTYSIAGASAGHTFLWLMFITDVGLQPPWGWMAVAIMTLADVAVVWLALS